MGGSVGARGPCGFWRWRGCGGRLWVGGSVGGGVWIVCYWRMHVWLWGLFVFRAGRERRVRWGPPCGLPVLLRHSAYLSLPRPLPLVVCPPLLFLAPVPFPPLVSETPCTAASFSRAADASRRPSSGPGGTMRLALALRTNIGSVGGSVRGSGGAVAVEGQWRGSAHCLFLGTTPASIAVPSASVLA